MRLRAIREYIGQQSCEHTPPKTANYYNVTFAKTNGVVVAQSNFSTQAEADFVVDAVNKAYDEVGGPEHHKKDWE